LREAFGDPKIHDSWTREQMIEAGFRPEFVNRIGLACDFNDITPADALNIAKLLFSKKTKELEDSRGIDLDVDESVAKEHAADVFDADFGARGIKRCVEDTMSAIVAAQAIALAIGPGCRIEASSVSSTITAKVTTADGKVSEARITGKDGNAELERLNAVLGGFSAVVKASAAQASISMPKEPASSANAVAKP
jgi:ATP-dependent protease Clp ATPase subunit